jgi:L-2-hydroxyglutarate oxidase LhgO
MIPRRSLLPKLSSSPLFRQCETLLTRLANARAVSSSPTPPINHDTTFDFQTDVLVIGAGVVGLAVARAAVARGATSVVLVERRSAFGTETSSRSSEVIHAGLYYTPGSLKATLCARGRDMLYDYCAEKNIAHKRIGKLVVATGRRGGGGDDDRRLEALAANADAACARAGAKPLGLRLLSGDQARNLEPSLSPNVSRALLSPRTGIVDSHALMAALLADAERGGGGGGGGGGMTTTLALRSAAVPLPTRAGGRGSNDGLLTVAVRDVGASAESGGETAVFGARFVFNCAGLGAEACAREALAHLGPGVSPTCPTVRYAKGNYFELAGGVGVGGGFSSGGGGSSGGSSEAATAPSPSFFSRLIYPLPEDGGLGIHLTLDLAGRARFGPDVEWLPPEREAKAPAAEPPFDFRVAPERAAAAGWHAAIRAYWPHLPTSPTALVPAYSGVRPKLTGPGEPAEDFGVQTARGASWRGGEGHGVAGLVNLFGVESPGLTSALALAEHVVEEAGL